MNRLDESATGVYLITVTPFTASGVIASSTIRKRGPKLSAADMADIARLTERQTRRLAELA